MTNTTKKSRFALFIVALFIMFAVVAFLMFRPISSAEKVVQDDGESKIYAPVNYDTSHWTKSPKQSVDFEQLKTKLGTTATQENTLDFYGNHAKKYRFSGRAEPPFYVIESDDVLEVAWYYAAPKDDERQKQASLNYAQKVYAMMGAYAGVDGEQLVQTILHHPNKPFGDKMAGVIMADCMNYQCRIVFQK